MSDWGADVAKGYKHSCMQVLPASMSDWGADVAKGYKHSCMQVLPAVRLLVKESYDTAMLSRMPLMYACGLMHTSMAYTGSCVLLHAAVHARGTAWRRKTNGNVSYLFV